MSTLGEVLPSLAACLGSDAHRDTLGLRDRLGGARRAVVVLVDGLGFHLLERAAPHAPLLAAALAGRGGTLQELASPLPSTTPTSLVTFGTGRAPGEHGVLGFTLNVPGTDRVLTHIFWRDDPPPRQWQPLPTVFETAGFATVTVQPALFAGSGLTDAAYRGARFAGLAADEDPAARVLAELDGARLVHAYTAVVDTAAHLHGIAAPQWAAAVAATDALLQRILDGLPEDAALLVTADHGGLDIGPAGRVDLAADPRLAAGLRVVAGEPRVRHLHVRPGAAEDVAGAWRAVLGPGAEVQTRDEAIAGGRFGPVADRNRERIGDLVVWCVDDETVVLATDREPPEVAQLIGFHGSVTAAETAVPLLVWRR